MIAGRNQTASKSIRHSSLGILKVFGRFPNSFWASSAARSRFTTEVTDAAQVEVRVRLGGHS